MIIKTTQFISGGFKSLFKTKAVQLGFFLFLISSVALAQAGKDGALTVSVANTVLNRYSRATADIPAGTNTVTVTNINELDEADA